MRYYFFKILLLLLYHTLSKVLYLQIFDTLSLVFFFLSTLTFPKILYFSAIYALFNAPCSYQHKAALCVHAAI